MIIQMEAEELEAAVQKAVQHILSKEKSEFLTSARKAEREAIEDLQAATDGFKTKSRAELDRAEEAYEGFKKKLSDALNVNMVAAVSAILLIASLIVGGLLAVQVASVKEKAKQVEEATQALTLADTRLQATIDATKTQLQTDSVNGSNSAVQLKTTSALAITTQNGLSALENRLKPIFDDYAKHHPVKSP